MSAAGPAALSQTPPSDNVKANGLGLYRSEPIDVSQRGELNHQVVVIDRPASVHRSS